MPERLVPSQLPESFDDEADIDEFLTRPSSALVDDLQAVDGDIVVLGAGGKMGPTLAGLAKRAAPDKTVTAVARFSNEHARTQLESWNVRTHTADLLERGEVAALPMAKNVIYMAGRKFGSIGAEHETWAMNAYVPALIAERYREARIIAFSTGCVYPFFPTSSQGPNETIAPNPPAGEYANSCVARERIFEHFSHRFDTPGRLIRLNYAIDLRYGVLHDVATRVFKGQPVELGMGHVNVIWQGDANAQSLRALAKVTTPTTPLNVTGPEVVSIRQLAEAFAARLGREVTFSGEEAASAWLNDSAEAARLFGYPLVPLAQMIAWVSDWVAKGGRSLGKPTGFEVRNGKF